jgi:hypothetical protein
MEKIKKIKSAIENQLKEINSIVGINSLILSVCLVDTMAGFYCGYEGQKGGNKDRYLRFVESYLNEYKDHLYDIRCNLTHSFSNTLANFMFVDNPEYSQVFPHTRKVLDWRIFNIDKFKKDLKEAIDQYFQDLESSNDQGLKENFNKRFDYVGILEDGVLPTVRTLDGKMVKNYDDMDELPGTGIKMALYNPTKLKE